MLRRAFIMLSCVSLRTLVVAIGLTLVLPNSGPLPTNAFVVNPVGNNQDHPDINNSNKNKILSNFGANQLNTFNEHNDNNRNNRVVQPLEQQHGLGDSYNKKDAAVFEDPQQQLKPFQAKQKGDGQVPVNSAQLQGAGALFNGANEGRTGVRPGERIAAGGGAGGVARRQFNDPEKQNIGLGPPPLGGVGKVAGPPQEGDLQTLDDHRRPKAGQHGQRRKKTKHKKKANIPGLPGKGRRGVWNLEQQAGPAPKQFSETKVQTHLGSPKRYPAFQDNFNILPASKKDIPHFQVPLRSSSWHGEIGGSEATGSKEVHERPMGGPHHNDDAFPAAQWQYAGKPFHPTVAYTFFNASHLKNGNTGAGAGAPSQSEQIAREMELARQNAHLNNGRLARERLKSKRLRKVKKPGVTAPPAKPSLDMKKHVSWFEGSRTFAFRASPDTRLLIRHAPIPAQGSPWPLPQHYYPEEAVFMLTPETFQFHAIGEMCDILDFQFERIRRNTFGDDWEKEESDPNYMMDSGDKLYKEIRYINVTVLKECPKYPKLNIDESYDLEIKRSGASIIAREIWGAVRALETFSQLIYQDDEGRYLINRTLINDFPRFPHRGILLDTARHYLNKETIINNLEAMAQNKMNVFHWHIVDDQSFPFESKTFPNLTKHGAYDHRTHTYTHETIAEIIEEARLRGIRVIPEFDTPGHTLSWGFGQDYLLTPCYDYNRQPNGQFGPINPILKSTYLFLQKFFREVLAVFKEKYIHLGGDEVPFDCWESNPQINNFIKRNNLSDIRDVLGLYERKLLEIVSQLGKTRDIGSGYIVWQEVVDNGVNVKPDTIVHVWMGDAFDIERIINMGLRVIYSTCWYLDYISYGQDWDKYYRCEQLEQLQEFQLKNSSLFLGGEAALWMEYADDENVISRLWPRASAAAERLWSNKKVRDEVAAASRIEEQRCRMLRRGLKVGVLSGPGYCPVWSRRGRPQQPKDTPNFWSSRADELKLRANFPQVYVVDMNAMYLVPVLIVICICCLTLITLAQDSRSKIVAILSYPVGGNSKKGVKGLLYVFMAFAFAWCIWTAPIWMNSWETTANKARPVAPEAKQTGY